MQGKYAFVVDDMIASGESILDTARLLKEIGVEKIFLVVTFALFTQGVSKFDEYYNQGIIDRVYATNVNYVPDRYLTRKWFQSVDCSHKLAYLISELNYGHSIGELINSKQDVAIKIKKLTKQ